MVWNRTNDPLPCFNAQLYYLSPDRLYDRKCIAPIRRDMLQCSLTMDNEETEEVTALTSELRSLSSPEKKRDLIKRVVLLRCCGEHHRLKLEKSTATLTRVVERYSDLLDNNLETNVLLLAQQQTPVNNSGRNRYCLRPRRGEQTPSEVDSSDVSQTKPSFVPYPSAPEDNIQDVLRSDVPNDFDVEGYVYAFVWPTMPDFVKIGYTRGKPSDRIAEWQNCHPGSYMIHSVAVPFPRRVERLIHLEMSRQRHQIILCNVCSSTHLEWFKLPADEVKATMDMWRLVTTEHRLYSASRKLTDPWKAVLHRTKRELTAQRLLGMLRAQELLAQPKTPLKNPPKTPKKSPPASTPITLSITISSLQDCAIDSCEKSWRRDWDAVSLYFDDFWRMV